MEEKLYKKGILSKDDEEHSIAYTDKKKISKKIDKVSTIIELKDKMHINSFLKNSFIFMAIKIL